MQLTNLYKIDGQPMYAPLEDMAVSMDDLDSSDSGRDEMGVMHRFPVRLKVKTFSFDYARLTKDEYAYMEGLFADKSSFVFTYPSFDNPAVSATMRAYRAKSGFTWRNAVTGDIRNYKFNIIEC